MTGLNKKVENLENTIKGLIYFIYKLLKKNKRI